MSGRSGSNTRRRTHQLGVRLDDLEMAVLDNLAEQFGSSRQETLRRLLVTDALMFVAAHPSAVTK